MLSHLSLRDATQSFKPLLVPPPSFSMMAPMPPRDGAYALPPPVLPSLRMHSTPQYPSDVNTVHTFVQPILHASESRSPSPSNARNNQSSHKWSLAFILSDPAPPLPHAKSKSKSLKRALSDTESSSDVDAMERDSLDGTRKRPTACATGSKSKYCIVDGCTSRAKHARKCWRHGGSVKCKVADCINRAKSRGVCWSHGGGTTCSHADCGTIAVSHGFCWAHGGGKRCQVGGCSRPAYERTENLCATHFKQQHKPSRK